MALSFAPLLQLQDLLRDAGLSASVNPEDVQLPGAWVTVEGIVQLTLDGGIELQGVVYLVAGDSDYQRAYGTLAELFNQLATVMTPDGTVVPQGVVMPGNPTPMPALRVPVNLY